MRGFPGDLFFVLGEYIVFDSPKYIKWEKGPGTKVRIFLFFYFYFERDIYKVSYLGWEMNGCAGSCRNVSLLLTTTQSDT